MENKDKNSNIGSSRRKFLKGVPAIAIGGVSAVSLASNKQIDNKNISPSVSKQNLDLALAPLQQVINKRRLLKTKIFSSLAQAVLKLSGIDKKDFYNFADGRIDRVGNSISFLHLGDQKLFLQQLIDRKVGQISDTAATNLSELHDVEEKENELHEAMYLFVEAFRKVAKMIEQKLKGGNVDAAILDKNELLIQEYKTLVFKFGSLSNMVLSFGLPLLNDGSTTFNNIPAPYKQHVWNYDERNPITTKDHTPGSCAIGASCEPDTLDCGLFDNCQHDTCGVGDDNTDCWVWDSAGEDEK